LNASVKKFYTLYRN